MPQPGLASETPPAARRFSRANATRTQSGALKLRGPGADVETGRPPAPEPRSPMSRSTTEAVLPFPPAAGRLPAALCQPAADAGCGHCEECRDAASRRFDEALLAGLESIRRSETRG